MSKYNFNKEEVYDLYINHNKLSLTRKFKSYIKLKSLIKLDKQINDIVDASVKTGG